MTTATENTYKAITIQDLIALSIADNERLIDTIIKTTVNNSNTDHLCRIGYKLSITLNNTYACLRKANALFLRDEKQSKAVIYKTHAQVIEARLERLSNSGKHDRLINNIYDNLAELDLLVHQLRSVGYDLIEYINQ